MCRIRLLASLLIPLALALAAVKVGTLQAAPPAMPDDALITITVNDHDDIALPPNGMTCDVSPAPGEQCTLRAAVQSANRSTVPVAIGVPSGVFTLTITGSNEDAGATGDLDITHTLSIQGAGAGSTLIQWDSAITPTLRDRIFHV